MVKLQKIKPAKQTENKEKSKNSRVFGITEFTSTLNAKLTANKE